MVRKLVFVTLLAVLALGGAWVVLRSYLHDVFQDYTRGYGDTILRYKDRSYEGAKWEKLPESESAANLVKAPKSPYLGCIAGWDDENYYVTLGYSDTNLFRVKDGVWTMLGTFEHSHDRQVLRLSSPDRAIFASCYAWDGSLWEVTPNGIRRLKDCHGASEPSEIVVVARDLFYAIYRRPVYRVSNDKVEVFEPRDGHKELFLHTRQNTPLKNFEVNDLSHARAVEIGKAYAYFPNKWTGESPRLGVFENGLWYDSATLPDKRPNDMWLGMEKKEPFVVLVGPAGWVHVKPSLGQAGFDQSLTTGLELTSANLLRAWGVSPAKYWVMDDNGTVWERAGTESRVVVRGLKSEGVTFSDAWVSPTGNVYAITNKHIYRLK